MKFGDVSLLFQRLVSEMTVEENILKKANQKRLLVDVSIEGGNFTTAFFREVVIYFQSLGRCNIHSKTHQTHLYHFHCNKMDLEQLLWVHCIQLHHFIPSTARRLGQDPSCCVSSL